MRRKVYSEIVPHTTTGGGDAGQGPAGDRPVRRSVAACTPTGAPQLDPALFDPGVPVFGICYGFQAMAQALGGDGRADRHPRVRPHRRRRCTGGLLHDGLPATQPVWMSHGDAVTEAPEGFEVTATSAGAPVAAFEDRDRRLAGVQYHPEVLHSPHGQQVLSRFLHEIAGIPRRRGPPPTSPTSWSTQVREQVGDGHAICGLSGGVDSAVAAALVQRAIGDRLTCVFVDHGLLRAGEREQVEQDFVAATGARPGHRRRGGQVPRRARRASPTPRRSARSSAASSSASSRARSRGHRRGRRARRPVEFLVQGTLYPDVVESGGGARHREHQEPPQRRRPARRPAVHAGRAAAPAVQGRGPRGRPRARPARGDRAAPAVPRSRARHPHRRRGHRRAARDPAPGRRHRPRGADGRRPGRADLAVPGRAARRRAQRSACRATAAPTVTRSCCARSPARTR